MWSEGFHPCSCSFYFKLFRFQPWAQTTPGLGLQWHTLSVCQPDKALKNPNLSSPHLCSRGPAGPTLPPILFHRSRLLELGAGKPPPLLEESPGCRKSQHMVFLTLHSCPPLSTTVLKTGQEKQPPHVVWDLRDSHLSPFVLTGRTAWY